MQPHLTYIDTLAQQTDTVILLTKTDVITQFCKNPQETSYVQKLLKDEGTSATINQYERQLYFIKPKGEPAGYRRKEQLRKSGAELFRNVQHSKAETLQIVSYTQNPDDILSFCEGLVLSSYEFLKYKSDKKGNQLKEVCLHTDGLTEQAVEELANLIEGTFIARDLVNEPVIFLTAEQLSKEITVLGEHAGFEVEVFNKSKIKSLKMGGLLAVNFGSPNPPTFNILEYKPENAVNKKPYILVGKGVVYDTGGLSLKPTPNSMDYMKSDMAGAAAVAGAMYALAKNNVPAYVIGLIPATENRLDGNAITPGDVITMHSGKTVEIMNTDAEGRLILADALSYASRYKPKLVIDLATLTGSAARAIGKEGIVYMGNAPKEVKNDFEDSGKQVYERLVEFPLWDEYNTQIESSIADLKNLGGADAGAITAGKFLEHFVNYDWLHLDIAGGAFLTALDSYRGKNGTGLGVRLLYHFISSKVKKQATG
jgi:leucyl aminopeptidase